MPLACEAVMVAIYWFLQLTSLPAPNRRRVTAQLGRERPRLFKLGTEQRLLSIEHVALGCGKGAWWRKDNAVWVLKNGREPGKLRTGEKRELCPSSSGDPVSSRY